MVSSASCSGPSAGTTVWIAQYRRLLDRCVTEVKQSSPAREREAFGFLFGLLDYVDECNDHMIFLADEGGAWQVDVEWERVLPPWFKVLAATAAPEEYAERTTPLLRHHYDYGRDKILVVARRAVNPEQRKALGDAAAWQTPVFERGGVMSEIPYSEFQASDRPPTSRELRETRFYSGRVL